MKIGILGGTFDPIHNGHLKIAEAARKKLGLNEVYFMPAAKTPLKEGISISAVEHRVKMVRLAIAGKPRFKLSTIELDRPGLSYTADTIAELRKQLGAETELYFIIGWDSLSQFARWREPARIIRMCRLVAVPRPGYSLPDPKAMEAAIPGIAGSLIVLDKPEIAISATEIRERVANGLSIRRLVPKPVAEYIQKNGLYLR